MAYICISKKNLLPGEELKISKNQACSWVYNVNRKWKSLTRKRGMSLPIGKKAIQMQSGKIFWRSIKSCGLSKAPRRKHWIGGVYPPKNYYKQCLGLIFIFLSFNNVVIKMHENMIESYINIFFPMTGVELWLSTGAFTSRATRTKHSQTTSPAIKPILCHPSFRRSLPNALGNERTTAQNRQGNEGTQLW